MKTKEEIREKHLRLNGLRLTNDKIGEQIKSAYYGAMQEFSDQENKSLVEEKEKLKFENQAFYNAISNKENEVLELQSQLSEARTEIEQWQIDCNSRKTDADVLRIENRNLKKDKSELLGALKESQREIEFSLRNIPKDSCSAFTVLQKLNSLIQKHIQ